MYSKIISMVALLLVVTVVLSSCGTGKTGELQSSDTSEEAASRVESEPEIIEPEVEEAHAGSGRYTREDVEQIPEMAEVHLKSAIEFSLSSYMWWVDKIDERGLRGSPDDFWPLTMMVEYAWYVYVIENGGTSPYIAEDGYRYAIPYQDMMNMVRNVFSSDVLPQTIRHHISYDADKDAFLLDEYTGYYVDTLLEFDLEWRDEGNRRIITMTEVQGNPTYDRQYDYLYEKGDDGRWRLSRAREELRNPASVVIDDANRIDSDYAVGIFTSIGRSIISKEYWDGQIDLYALDPEDFSLKAQQSFDHGEVLLIPYGDKIMLQFERQVVVLDDRLEILLDAPLPDAILAVLDREVTYVAGEWGETAQQFFTGYGVSPDLRLYAYGTEVGLFLYDTETGETQQLEQSTTGSWPGNDRVVFTFWEPRFTADGSGIYTKLSVYEGPRDYFYYDIAAGEGFSVKERIGFSLISPLHSGMGSYFGAYDWEWTYYFGENHYLLHDAYSMPNRFQEWVVAPLDDVDGAKGRPVINSPLDERFYYNFVALLSDGRVVFSVSEAWDYNTQYYVSEVR